MYWFRPFKPKMKLDVLNGIYVGKDVFNDVTHRQRFKSHTRHKYNQYIPMENMIPLLCHMQ